MAGLDQRIGSAFRAVPASLRGNKKGDISIVRAARRVSASETQAVNAALLKCRFVAKYDFAHSISLSQLKLTAPFRQGSLKNPLPFRQGD